MSKKASKAKIQVVETAVSERTVDKQVAVVEDKRKSLATPTLSEQPSGSTGVVSTPVSAVTSEADETDVSVDTDVEVIIGKHKTKAMNEVADYIQMMCQPSTTGEAKRNCRRKTSTSS